MKKEYLTREDNETLEIAKQKSVEDFIMKHVFPRLNKEDQEEIQKYLNEGIRVAGAFDLAGVELVTMVD